MFKKHKYKFLVVLILLVIVGGGTAYYFGKKSAEKKAEKMQEKEAPTEQPKEPVLATEPVEEPTPTKAAPMKKDLVLTKGEKQQLSKAKS